VAKNQLAQQRGVPVRPLLLGKDGVIARLRASGYAIEEPELLPR
jgi:hypothetical protein